MWRSVIREFGLEAASTEARTIGNGLINRTWELRSEQGHFILQQVNNEVFLHPEKLAENIRLIGAYLKEHHPAYLFVKPIESLQGRGLIKTGSGGYFRLFPFVEGSVTINVVHNPRQAFEASRQFGMFTRLLSGFPPETLQETLPDFHNLTLRYQQFEEALPQAGHDRLNNAKQLIRFLQSNQDIVATFHNIKTNTAFKKRVTHHDTKISNILFNSNDDGLCVIDLDTVMPGYFISDVGDMIRTYLSPVTEEEKNFAAIEIRENYFKAIYDGYMSQMADELTLEEKTHFIYAGKYMIYMQAVRFLTDYLLNDTYYGAKYEGHNLVRAGNQVALLQAFFNKEEMLQQIVEDSTLVRA